MNEHEREAMSLNNPILMQQLKVDEVARYLYAHTVILPEHYESLQRESNVSKRRMYLVELIKNRREGWRHFCFALEECGQLPLREMLENTTLIVQRRYFFVG